MNGFVFVDGQLPLNPETGTVVEGGIREQVDRARKNIRALLEEAGSGVNKVVRRVVFLKNMDDYAAMNVTSAAFFGGKLPARTTVEVPRLPRNCRVEIEATALQ